MKLDIDGKYYEIIIEKKSGQKNTYIRVKKDLKIYVTTNKFTSTKFIKELIEDNYSKIVKMIETQEKKKENNEGFFYLGKKYDIVYVSYCDISFGENKVFLNKNLDIDKWYKNQAKSLFLEHLDEQYHKFSRRIPYPSLKIRKMTSRWGVCNIKNNNVTLNYQLSMYDICCLDYVIVHELSHFIHPNHSKDFWNLVGKYYPRYKECRKMLKE